MTQHGNRLLAALVASVLLAAPAAAASFDELLGRWCSSTLEYRFTREQIIVTQLQGQSLNHGTTLQITGSEPLGSGIRVKWRDGKGEDFVTDYEVGGGQLVQLLQSGGDKGPRRVFRRCG